VKTQKLTKFLKNLFMKFNKYLSLLFLFVVSMAAAQQVEIKGKVTENSSSLPLPGVNVVIKNTTRGTTTDFDGNYTIKAAPNEILVFSFVGYESKEVTVKSENTINVSLAEENKSLEEVVVVGYGTQKKSVVTGAISSIKAKDIENIPNGRIEQTLQGRTSGVIIAANAGQPGSPATVRVRGITTFDTYGGNNPLWVVDGVIVDNGAIGFVNQADIESMEVLKDAASLAIYGARAASGVILVTTKKGKQGKMTLNYNGFYGVSSPAKMLNLLNATEYGAIMNEKAVAAGQNLVFPDLSTLGVGTDWQKQIFNNNAQRNSHEVSVGGGGEISTFFLSFGSSDQEGIVATEISNFNKKNFRINSTHKFKEWVTIGQTLGYTHQKGIGLGNTNSEYGGPLSSAINLDPTTPVVVTDPAIANAAPYNNNPVIRDANGNPYGISSLVGQEMTNPLAYIQTRLGQYGWSDDFVGNIYFDFKLHKDFKFRTTIGGKLAYWGAEGFTPEYYLNASTLTSQNNISRRNNKSFGWNIENTLTYTKQIEKHNITVLLGQGAYQDNKIYTETGVTYFDIPVTNYQDASFNFDVPASQRSSYSVDGVEHNVNSLFARVNYDYNEKYLFNGVIRRDGSSRFGQNNQYGVFPSFSVGWVASNEDFWKENKVVTNLKIRAGYGVTGNDAIPDFGYLSTIGGGRNYTIGDAGNITSGYSPNAPSNPDLKWEETAQTNIGFDAKIYNDFNFTFEWYKKVTTGILQYQQIPGYVGATGQPLANIADMENSGLEFELGYKKKFGEFNFSVNANYSTLNNEVTHLGNGIEYITNGSAGFQSMGPITRTQVGEAYNSFYGYQTAGIFQNQDEINAYTNGDGGLIQPDARPGDFRWTDSNGDGTINDEDRVFLGSSLPTYNYGFTINLDYKGFDFMAFAQGAGGNKIFQGLRRLDVGNANYQTDALGRWTGEGTSNSYPRLTNNDTNGNFGKPSDFYLEDGDYLRLKLVQFGYSLPNDVIGKVGLQKLRFYITGENLLTFTKYTGYDPEIGGSVFGVDRGYYPQARSVMFGANLQF
jgi:TonB-linked SusC/RagA family outer membrane protein